MKVLSASFQFRSWECIWKFQRFTIRSGRRYIIWDIEIFYKNNLKGRHKYLAFVPSACICRRLINQWYK